ncbi:Eukaryotic translation initiation factor 3 subunit G-1 [Spatholobus suberectus]|nr:Eukaryotic translation initiation factor 3 subunit G-1 [Spatholobus suberectus]
MRKWCGKVGVKVGRGPRRCCFLPAIQPHKNQVIGPNENGIKKVIKYKSDEDDNKVNITTIACTRKLANTRLSKCAVERSSWPKFGDAVHKDVGNRHTMVSIEEILLEHP